MENDLKTLLEFMRIKAPELNIRQNQLARIIFIFFILNVFLFLVITDGIGSVALRLKNPVSISDLISISEPRVFVVLGTTLVVFFYFVRFGYLYLQSVKEVASTHNVIDTMLPLYALDATTKDIREALTQTCRSNYIVQTIVVFLYTPTAVDHKSVYTEGPLSGSSLRRGAFIKFVMILTTMAFGWIIAVSQFMMIVVLLALAKWGFSLLLFFAFSLYYYFYLEYIVRKSRELNESWELWITAVGIVAILIIVVSLLANGAAIWNSDKSPNVFSCRMNIQKIAEISPPAATFVSFLFKEQVDSKRDVDICELGPSK